MIPRNTSLVAAVALLSSVSLPGADETSVLPESYGYTLSPTSSENPRNDQAQILPLKGGRLMLVYTQYYADRPSYVDKSPYAHDAPTDDFAPCELVGRISRDNGRTWSSRFVLQENTEGTNAKQPNLLRLKDGGILFIHTRGSRDTHQREIMVRRSDDEAETWSRSTVFWPPALPSNDQGRDTDPLLRPGYYVLDGGRIFQHSSGRVILPTFWSPKVWHPEEHYVAFALYSDDAGETWQKSENVLDVPGRGAMEPTMAEAADGSVVAILRTTQGTLYTARSHDAGRSWSEPVSTDLASPQSNPCLKRLPESDRLVLLWNHAVPYAVTNPGSNDWSRPRNPLTCAVSDDQGVSWRILGDIERRDGFDIAYPNILASNGEALVTYWMRSVNMGKRGSDLQLRIYPLDLLLGAGP